MAGAGIHCCVIAESKNETGTLMADDNAGVVSFIKSVINQIVIITSGGFEE